MFSQGINTSASLIVASCALFIYDYALTFSKEIDLFWRKDRRAWSFVLFITNRYVGLLGRILELFRVFPPNNNGLDDSWWE
ncbi:hypothetical protein M404DRAFT_535244 [Pisolithus tinctorius Marx 270]|uniref:DUF6533 domain-containing protein n=1 Tax=Pisolithus tinctorius Marx 270 TaxID=870435 RepID=A0A0C3PBV7_PISTI|nr:hypothetical protein M404DRAFT_535244 [Pisolithus tinctorius Marx 270]